MAFIDNTTKEKIFTRLWYKTLLEKEKAKKWIKDTSDEARAKWYQANYELARIEKGKTY